MKTPFKMKSSPTKGKLQNFFNSVGANLKRNKKDVGAELKEKYNRTKETTPKAGESKYQASIRNRKATNKAKKSMVDKDKDGMSDFIQAPKKAPKGQATVSSKPKAKVKATTKKKVSYAAAYKNADKKKYPTLASFTTAAKVYNDEKKK
jgi:hypothetical protein